jgi:hypothetical protein
MGIPEFRFYHGLFFIQVLSFEHISIEAKYAVVFMTGSFFFAFVISIFSFIAMMSTSCEEKPFSPISEIFCIIFALIFLLLAQSLSCLCILASSTRQFPFFSPIWALSISLFCQLTHIFHDFSSCAKGNLLSLDTLQRISMDLSLAIGIFTLLAAFCIILVILGCLNQGLSTRIRFIFKVLVFILRFFLFSGSFLLILALILQNVFQKPSTIFYIFLFLVLTSFSFILWAFSKKTQQHQVSDEFGSCQKSTKSGLFLTWDQEKELALWLNSEEKGTGLKPGLKMLQNRSFGLKETQEKIMESNPTPEIQTNSKEDESGSFFLIADRLPSFRFDSLSS